MPNLRFSYPASKCCVAFLCQNIINMGKISHFVSSTLRLRLRNAPGIGESNAWINDDIRPLPPSRRKWTSSTYLGWWAIWMMGLSNFQIGSSMVAIGLSVWQTMIVVILGRILIAGTAVLNGYVGAEWHIGFPVFSRVLWGMRVCSLHLLSFSITLLIFEGLIHGHPVAHSAWFSRIRCAILERRVVYIWRFECHLSFLFSSAQHNPRIFSCYNLPDGRMDCFSGIMCATHLCSP